MKNSLILLLLVSLLATTTVLAQRHRPHPPRTMELTDELKAELALTPEQITAIDELQTETKTALDELRQQEGLEPSARREAMRELHHNTKDDLRGILSDEQLAQLRNIRKAQQEEQRELMKSVDRKAMNAELREYKELNIKPVVAAQRAELEKVLSEGDKERLVEYRIVLADAKEKARAEHQTARTRQQAERANQKEGQGHSPHRRHQQRARTHQRPHELHPEIFADLEAMVERYDNAITDLLEEMADDQEQWKADQKAIRERYLPAEVIAQHQERRTEHKPNPERQTRREQARKVHFLLQDPLPKAEVAAAAETVAIAAASYPNPATNSTTLSFELPTAAVIRIDLRDEQGSLVKNITRANYAEGKNQVEIDLSELTNGTYYLTLNSRTFQTPQSVKILVVK